MPLSTQPFSIVEGLPFASESAALAAGRQTARALQDGSLKQATDAAGFNRKHPPQVRPRKLPRPECQVSGAALSIWGDDHASVKKRPQQRRVRGAPAGSDWEPPQLPFTHPGVSSYRNGHRFLPTAMPSTWSGSSAYPHFASAYPHAGEGPGPSASAGDPPLLSPAKSTGSLASFGSGVGSEHFSGGGVHRNASQLGHIFGERQSEGRTLLDQFPPLINGRASTGRLPGLAPGQTMLASTGRTSARPARERDIDGSRIGLYIGTHDAIARQHGEAPRKQGGEMNLMNSIPGNLSQFAEPGALTSSSLPSLWVDRLTKSTLKLNPRAELMPCFEAGAGFGVGYVGSSYDTHGKPPPL